MSVTPPRGSRAPRPAAGEHTDEVLREMLGMDDARLAELREAGVI
jgi:crotonobetainyl-CoA:carnitine CoA-transferase CaiB-like acyl-CoA transferase